MCSLLIYVVLLLFGVVDSFSLSLPTKYTRNINQYMHMYAKKTYNHKRYASNNQSKQSNIPKRVPQNKRTAILWVIQGVERCLAVEEGDEKGKKNKSYKRRIDASLVDALYLMVNANTQKEVIDSEKRIQVLMKNHLEFDTEVNERVIKATAMAGLSRLSLSLLQNMLNEERIATLPSPMAYTAVLNCLRKQGRVDRAEDTLAELASCCRRISAQKTGIEVGVDLIALNIFLASLCDAAVNEVPFSSSTIDVDEKKTLGSFNFTSLTSNSTTTSSSEKYLYKAINLLRGDTARTRFALEADPDRYSYNSVLNAAAKCSKPGAEYTKSIMLSCLRGMKERGITMDMFTFNARIQAALQSDDDEAAIKIIDTIIQDPNLELDRYTIDLLLKPFINTGRREDIWYILDGFYEANIESNSKLLSSAFEAFLVSLVDTGETELAREIFYSFFLSSKQLPNVSYRRKTVGPLSLLRPRTRHFNILLGGYSKAYQDKSYMTDEEIDESLGDALELLDIMIEKETPIDGYTVSSLMSLPFSSPEKITSLLKRIEPEMMTNLNAAAYRSTIFAYAKAGEASSSLYMFEEMIQTCRGNQGKNRDSWNVLLGALAKGCDVNNSTTLDILNSSAALARRNMKSQANEDSNNQFISLLNGQTCFDACMTILDTMRNEIILPEGYRAPKPNSQSYCLVATALSHGPSNPELALTLFNNAKKERVSMDGRFLNAVIRCFGDDIDGALSAWKTELGPAAAAYERVAYKRGTNVIAAYNGLMHVSGRAVRPDIALRVAYAMNKSGVKPTEITLNSYHAGKRITLEGSNDSNKNIGLRNQYESLLSVECTKFSSKDKRRVNERKIRIIL